MPKEKITLNRRLLLRRIFLFPVFTFSTFYFFSLSSGDTNTKPQKADLIVVWKKKRKMVLFHQSIPIREYSVKLGFNPIGHKIKEGDGRTPEGKYFIDRVNLNSKYHKSLGISYPNKADKEASREKGFDPGGDIFIHGGPRKNWLFNFFRDWTAGCIAVSDREIDEIVSLVSLGTVIYIYE